MMIDHLELQKLRDLPIEGVAQRLGLTVSRHKCLCPFHADKHPSLTFSTSRNTYRCWVCGASGGTIDLVMNHLKLVFREACEWLADSHNVILDAWKPPQEAEVKEMSFNADRYVRFFEHPYLSPEARHFLFDQRHLDPRVIAWCRLTSWRDRDGIDWLQIPYYDMEGRLIGVQNRRLPSEKFERFEKFEGFEKFEKCEKFEGFEKFESSSTQPTQTPQTLQTFQTPQPPQTPQTLQTFQTSQPPPPPQTLQTFQTPQPPQTPQTPQTFQTPQPPPPPRFKFPKGSKTSIYNLPMLRHLQPGDECWIAEGSSDCWSLMSARHKALAIPSATLLMPSDKELLQRLTAELSLQWHMAPDRDEPGLRLASQLKEILPMLQIIDLPDGCKDYSDFFLLSTQTPQLLCQTKT